MDNGELAEARVYFETASAMSPEKFGMMMPVFLLNFARLHYREGNVEKCLELLDECEEVATQYQDIRALCKIKQVRANTHLNRGENLKALAIGEAAYEMAEKSKLMDLIDETTALLADIYHANGDNDRAYEFQSRSTELREKTANRSDSKPIGSPASQRRSTRARFTKTKERAFKHQE